MLRDPVARFVSGFNSRLRQGLPKRNSPWSRGEEISFSAFKTPNDLAEALSSAEDSVQEMARFAMRSIKHTRRSQRDWFPAPERLSGDPAMLWIGFTETLSADFERLKRLLGLPPELSLPTDPLVAHRTPDGFDTALTPLGRANIERWYREDIRFVAGLRADKELCARGSAPDGLQSRWAAMAD